MKKIFWIITCCFVCQLASAQIPKWAEKARKAVFSIVTYDKENQIKGTGNGFYIDAKGIALSDYTLFENAERAVIINADGKQKDVTSILGANDIYDIIKFNTPIDKKQVVLTIAKQPAKTGEVVYLLPYSTQNSILIFEFPRIWINTKLFCTSRDSSIGYNYARIVHFLIIFGQFKISYLCQCVQR